MECVATIKSIMSQSGVSATHSSQKHSLNVATAQNLLEKVRSLEEQFSVNPSHSLVTELMDHLREAVECFGEANDDRYTGVIAHIQAFLQRADVLAILDPSSVRPPPPPADGASLSPPGDTTCSDIAVDAPVAPVESVEAEQQPSNQRVYNTSFAESFAALASDLAALEEAFSEVDAEDDFEFEEEFCKVRSADDATAFLEEVGGDHFPQIKSRPQRMDSLEYELNDMLGNISMEFESLVGNVDDIKVPSNSRKSDASRRNSSMGGGDVDFDAFVASL